MAADGMENGETQASGIGGIGGIELGGSNRSVGHRGVTVAQLPHGLAGERAAGHPADKPRLHLAYVDGLRFLMALWVLLAHDYTKAWPTTYHVAPSAPLIHLVGWLDYAHLAVSVFIVISGFCLMLPVAASDGQLRGGVVPFIGRRARRILPPFYAALALTLLLIWLWIGQPSGSNFDAGLPVTPQALLATALLVQDAFAPYKISGVFWSIGVEWRIYFLFPLLILLRRVSSGVLLLIGAALPFALAVTIWPSWFGFLPVLRVQWLGLAPTYVTLFCLGMLAAVLALPRRPSERWLRDRVPWPALAIVLAAGLIALGWLWGGYNALTNVEWTWLDLLAGLAGASLLVGGARQGPSAVRRVLGLRPLVIGGGFAYSIYLLHNPLEQLGYVFVARPLVDALGSPDALGGLPIDARLAVFAVLLVLTPAVLAACYLFYLAFERPFLSRRA